MTVKELIAKLEDLNQNAEVYIAYQPHYPLCAKASRNVAENDDEDKVYIMEGFGGNEYLPEGIEFN